MEIFTHKKFFTSLYLLVLVFLLTFSLSIWVTVFTLPGPFQHLYEGGVTWAIGIHEGNIEVAFLVSLVIIVISLLPLILGLLWYWQGGSKRSALIRVIVQSIILDLIALLLVWISGIIPFLFYLYVFLPFIPLGVAVAVISYLTYALLFSFLDNKKAYLLLLIIGVGLLIVGITLPQKLYMASGCDKGTDEYCLGDLALARNDISVCDSLTVKYRRDACRLKFANTERDPDKCLLLRSTRENGEGLSPQGTCLLQLASYADISTNEKLELCSRTTNTSDKNFCTELVRCREEQQDYSKYLECEKGAYKFFGTPVQ